LESNVQSPKETDENPDRRSRVPVPPSCHVVAESEDGSQILKAHSRCSVTGLFHEGVTRRVGEGEKTPPHERKSDFAPWECGRQALQVKCASFSVTRLWAVRWGALSAVVFKPEFSWASDTRGQTLPGIRQEYRLSG